MCFHLVSHAHMRNVSGKDSIVDSVFARLCVHRREKSQKPTKRARRELLRMPVAELESGLCVQKIADSFVFFFKEYFPYLFGIKPTN